MGTHPIFESDFDCLTDNHIQRIKMSYTPYSSPIDPAFYSTLALLLMISGLATSAFFIVKQITTSKSSRTLSNDVAMASTSAVLLGLGMVFTMLTVGIYV